MSTATSFQLQRPLVMVGLMGAGKSSIGRRLAQRLGLPFVDADDEIEAAAGCTIPDFFSRFGEDEFRRGEERVICRLLDGPPQVVATGGGAFMSPLTREKVKQHGVSIWLRAELDVLLRRVKRRNNRPLLAGKNQRQVLQGLIDTRYPVYAEADVVVDSGEGPHEEVVERIVAELQRCGGAPVAVNHD
ncbi:MAG: shikimate kinase [Alphaproteobacteria bacterium]